MATRQEQDNLVSWPFSCLLDIWHLNEKRGPPKSLSCCPHISHPQAQSLTHILIWCCSWCGYWHLHPYYNIHVYGECMHYYLLSNEDIHAMNDDDEDDISLLLRWSICQVLILSYPWLTSPMPLIAVPFCLLVLEGHTYTMKEKDDDLLILQIIGSGPTYLIWHQIWGKKAGATRIGGAVDYQSFWWNFDHTLSNGLLGCVHSKPWPLISGSRDGTCNLRVSILRHAFPKPMHKVSHYQQTSVDKSFPVFYGSQADPVNYEKWKKNKK